MTHAVLWIGDVDEDVRAAFATQALRLEVSAGLRDAVLAVQRAEPAFVIFARWTARCGRLIAQWRQAGRDMPVVVGVQSDAAHCRAALDAGATDYLLRPFSAEAAITRLRTHTIRPLAPHQLVLGACTVDLARRTSTGPAGVEPLTDLEAGLLRFLSTQLDVPVRTETILRQVWGYASALPTRAVANTVMRLRRKLEVDPRHPQFLQTIRGVGYRLSAATPHKILPPDGRPLVGRTDLLESTSQTLASFAASPAESESSRRVPATAATGTTARQHMPRRAYAWRGVRRSPSDRIVLGTTSKVVSLERSRRRASLWASLELERRPETRTEHAVVRICRGKGARRRRAIARHWRPI